MRIRLSNLNFFLILAGIIFLQGQLSYAQKISDMGRAIDYCTETALVNPEGIWEFADDETIVLIKRSDPRLHRFDIIVVDTPDCRLNPGEKIGSLERTANSDKFRLSLYTSRKTGLLSDLRSCAAELRENGDSFIFHPRKIKISIRYPGFLPKFWRSLRVTLDNPAATLPYGLIRRYPRSVPSYPIFL